MYLSSFKSLKITSEITHIIDSTWKKNGCVVLHSSHRVPQKIAVQEEDKRDLTTNSSNNVFYWHEKQTKSLQNLTTNFILDIRKYIYRIECAYMSKMPLISSRKVFFYTSNRTTTRVQNQLNFYMSTLIKIEYSIRVLVYTSTLLL